MAVVVLAALAQRVGMAYPILLALGGLALGFVPGLPAVELDPELVFLLFLPPLLYYDALFTSWRDFRFNLRPVLLLAVGLVLMTTVVATVAHWMAGLPGVGSQRCPNFGIPYSFLFPFSSIAVARSLPHNSYP